MSLAGFPLSSNYLDQLKNYSRHFRLKASTVSEDDAVFLSGSYFLTSIVQLSEFEIGQNCFFRPYLSYERMAGTFLVRAQRVAA